MDPFSEEMIRSYQNDERVNQDWNAKFDKITGMISQSSNEFNKEVKNAMLGYMDMFGIAVVNTNKKVEKIDCQVQEVASRVKRSDARIDFLEEEMKRLSQKNLSRNERQKDKDYGENHKQRMQHKTKEKEIRVHRSRHSDKTDKIHQTKEKTREREQLREKEQKRKRESRSESTRRSHESTQKKCCSPNHSHRYRSSCSPVLSGSRIERDDSNTIVISYQQQGGIAEKDDLILLTEVELNALMKGRDCVKFIGELVLSSFPDGYFLEKENSFKAATNSRQMDKFFGIVYNRFKFIKRPGKPSKPLTKEEMTEVIKNKVDSYRTKNRQLIK